MLIVPGRPEDAPAAARLIVQTAPGLFRLLAAGEEAMLLEVFEHEWRKEAGIFSSTTGRVVRAGDELLAVLVSYPEHRHATMDFTFAAPPERVPPEFLRRLNERSRSLSYLFPLIQKGIYYIQNLAVAPAARGRGLGRALLEWAFAEALRQRCDSLHLDVEQGEEAVRFYEHLGMRVLVETVGGGAEVPRYYRMAKDFSGTGPSAQPARERVQAPDDRDPSRAAK
jgi:GNAT superfamily N-acetyltransferase